MWVLIVLTFGAAAHDIPGLTEKECDAARAQIHEAAKSMTQAPTTRAVCVYRAKSVP